ncbi:hypothetical protein DSO57_1019479 [Entomophthora muscae]|uniref:Uncharacterized protein n=1 Tax=Entomophthora muscae TaxID=34485 RepID=A0ACC2T4B1_9FUNG|nr:hypothetical protein DSO57_1019479 [Entomophthora muscae]
MVAPIKSTKLQMAGFKDMKLVYNLKARCSLPLKKKTYQNNIRHPRSVPNPFTTPSHFLDLEQLLLI